jgi:hypothetical protein
VSDESERPDVVEVYEDEAGEWRWRRKDPANGKIVSDSGEGYVDRWRAVDQARELNPGCEVRS